MFGNLVEYDDNLLVVIHVTMKCNTNHSQSQLKSFSPKKVMQACTRTKIQQQRPKKIIVDLQNRRLVRKIYICYMDFNAGPILALISYQTSMILI